MWGLNPSLFREKLQILSYLWLQDATPVMRFMARLCFSLCYLYRCSFFFLICQMCSCHSAALRFLRGNCSMCSCGLGMSMGVGEFRIFLYYHLEPEVLFGFVHLNSTLVFRNKLCFKVGDSLYFLSSFQCLFSNLGYFVTASSPSFLKKITITPVSSFYAYDDMRSICSSEPSLGDRHFFSSVSELQREMWIIQKVYQFKPECSFG